MSQQPRVQKTTVIRVELTEQQYEALSKRAKEAGYSSVEAFVEAAISGAAVAPVQLPEGLEERLTKRVERIIQDVLNPFTQKVDELARRLAQVQEDVEFLKEALRQRPQERPVQRPQAERAAEQSAAIERLRRQGVVFSEDVAYLRAPDKFFAKLERLGAVVIQLPEGQVAVDADFWRKFLAELESTSLRDARQVADKLAASMGDRAAALFNRLVKSGLAVYDEDSRKWSVRSVKGRVRAEEEEEESEEEEGEEEGY